MYHDKMDQRGTKEGPKRDQRWIKVCFLFLLTNPNVLNVEDI